MFLSRALTLIVTRQVGYCEILWGKKRCNIKATCWGKKYSAIAMLFSTFLTMNKIRLVYLTKFVLFLLWLEEKCKAGIVKILWGETNIASINLFTEPLMSSFLWLKQYYLSLIKCNGINGAVLRPSVPFHHRTMVEAGEGVSHVGSVMNQLEDTSREIKECYERWFLFQCCVVGNRRCTL